MANLYQRDGSDVWWLRFTHEGRCYRESTGEISEAKAAKVLRERLHEVKGSGSPADLYRRLCDALDRITVDESMKLRQEFATGLLSGIGRQVSFDEAWEVWKASPNRGDVVERTLKDYSFIWLRFYSWAKGSDLSFLHEVSRSAAEEYAAELLASGISARTYNKALTFLRAFWTALEVRAGLAVNPWSALRNKAKVTNSRRMLEPAELTVLCGTAEGWMRPLLAVGIYTGMRLHDAVTLRWAEIDLANGLITRVTAKRKKPVIVPVHPVLAVVLQELGPGSGYVFPELAALYERDNSAISKQVRAHFWRCGIDCHAAGTGWRIERDGKGQPIRDKDGQVSLLRQEKRAVVETGFHALRHSFVSLCAANRVPQSVIQELVGHGSPAVTAIYTHASEEARRSIAGLPDVTQNLLDGDPAEG